LARSARERAGAVRLIREWEAMPEVARVLLLFVLAGIAEIGGGWLIWQWLREGRPWPWGLLGALVLTG
jgi:hypothetical protein